MNYFTCLLKRRHILVAGLSLMAPAALMAEAASTMSKTLAGKQTCVVTPPAPGADVQDGYVWKPLVVGGGGFIMSIDISADGAERIARNDTYGAHRWEGNRWKQLVTAQSMPADDVVPGDSGEGVTEIVFAPSDSTRLYMQFKGFVYRSNNRGDTWQRTAFAKVAMGPNDEFRQQGPRLAVDPVNPDVVYAGTQMDGLFVSLDGGASWSKVNAIPRGADEPLNDPSQPDNRATKGPGIKVWFDPASAVVSGRKQGIVVNSNGNGFWRSTNAGGTWQRISSPGSGPVKADHGVVASDGTLYMAAYKEGKLWRYRNGAWADISVPGDAAIQRLRLTHSTRIQYGPSMPVSACGAAPMQVRRGPVSREHFPPLAMSRGSTNRAPLISSPPARYASIPRSAAACGSRWAPAFGRRMSATPSPPLRGMLKHAALSNWSPTM